MTLGAYLVLSELRLRSLPGFWINDRWDWDGNPLTRRPPGPAVAIAPHAILTAAPAIRQVHIGAWVRL